MGEGIKNMFGAKSTVLIGPDAKEEEVIKLPLEKYRYKYRYITFGTHGILDNTVPYIKEPALVLSQIGNSEGYDGFLTMSEVMGLKMKSDVVALTACETGVGKNVSGEGVMGMGRAFQYAGAGNVLMSLWSVDESAAVELTKSFLSYLKDGHNAKEALSLARKEIRNNGYEHPFYWSAFILVVK
jgi:CHAT domain-containing protein